MAAALEVSAFLQLWILLLISGMICGHVNGPNAAMVVKEGSEFILSCSILNQDLGSKLFDWKKDENIEVFMYDGGVLYSKERVGQDPQFRERVTHFPDELKDGNASIKISNAKIEDSGTYRCILPRLGLDNPTLNSIEVIVERIFKDRSGEILGASPKPYLRIHNATVDKALLQCDVEGAFPKPIVKWKDGAGKLLPAENLTERVQKGRHYVTTFIFINVTDHVHCVVTQEEIHHNTSAETYVFVSGKACECDSSKAIPFLSIVVVILGVLVLSMCIKKHCNIGCCPAAEEVSPDASGDFESRSLCSKENSSSNLQMG